MKILGIDYGAKRVGLAVSDESGKIAFPKEILVNNEKLMEKLSLLAGVEGIDKIILGESLAADGEPNEIMKDILILKKKLEKRGFRVELEKEFMTSLLARRGPVATKPVASPRRKEKRKGLVDSRAAALILQRYLDRIEK